MRSRAVRMIAAPLAVLLLGTAAFSAEDAPSCSNCHDVELADPSVHAIVPCAGCHGDAEAVPHDADLKPVDCAGCHEEVVTAYRASAHGRTSELPAGVERPGCTDCHGDAHAIAASTLESSRVHPARQVETCGRCQGGGPAAPPGVRTIQPIEAYSASIHARAVAAGKKAASCSACHTSHSVLLAADPASSVHRANIPSTCGRCHTEIAAVFIQSIHGQAAAAGVEDAPVCNDCHGEHRILSISAPGSPVSPANLPSRTCGPCHADLRLSERYGLPADQVPAYEDSFHGLAARAGVQRVANCASCHGVHLILPSSDPRSDVHPDRLAQTCGRCHPGAGSRFAIGPVHVLAATTPNVVARWIRAIYVPLIWVVIGGMLLHNALDFVKKARSPRIHRLPPAGTYRVLERMSLGFRIAHGLVVVSFAALVVTGFALQYPESWWAALFQLGGAQAELRAGIHRIAAIVLLVAVGFHLSHLLASRRARRGIAAMMPRLADLREMGERVGYNTGLRADPPRRVRVGYIEKLEYWAFMWGTLIMTVSGFVLWLENLTLAWLPGWVPEAATALHLYEAILATAAIAVWHLYWVVFDPVVYPMDPAWLGGRAGYERALERGEVVSDDGEGDGSA